MYTDCVINISIIPNYRVLEISTGMSITRGYQLLYTRLVGHITLLRYILVHNNIICIAVLTRPGPYEVYQTPKTIWRARTDLGYSQ